MWEALIMAYKFGGENAVRRMLTVPRKTVERVCAKTGANVAQAINERNEAVEEMVEFIASMIEVDFEDPD